MGKRATRSTDQANARLDVLAAFDAAVKMADPARMVKRHLELKNNRLVVNRSSYDLNRFKRVIVIGGGKASARMAVALEKVIGDRITEGLVIAPEYQRGLVNTRIVEVDYAGHPIPDVAGLKGVRRMIKLIGNPGHEDLVICLLSGGGSSLLPFPLGGISLEEKRKVTRLLLNSGADIKELNIVRKHLSGFKGGRLAELLYPANVISLIVSDVVGDDMGTIASGPTVPDESTYADAESVLRSRGVWGSTPKSVRKLIADGVLGNARETPKPGARIFSNVKNVLIGSNIDACLGAQRKLASLGYKATVLTSRVIGEARELGLVLSAMGIGVAKGVSTVRRPAAFVLGGETTVRVVGRGRGGRNQEVALSASRNIMGVPGVSVGSFGTDGVDGPTDAAGAVVDSFTLERAKRAGVDPERYLADNNSYNFLKETSDLVFTGPTFTNVGDVMIVAVR